MSSRREIEEKRSQYLNIIERVAGDAQEGEITVTAALEQIQDALKGIESLQSEPTCNIYVFWKHSYTENGAEDPSIMSFKGMGPDLNHDLFAYPMMTSEYEWFFASESRLPVPHVSVIQSALQYMGATCMQQLIDLGELELDVIAFDKQGDDRVWKLRVDQEVYQFIYSW